MKIFTSFLDRITVKAAMVMLSLIGCCGFGFSINHSIKSKIDEKSLSLNDTIVLDNL